MLRLLSKLSACRLLVGLLSVRVGSYTLGGRKNKWVNTLEGTTVLGGLLQGKAMDLESQRSRATNTERQSLALNPFFL